MCCRVREGDSLFWKSVTRTAPRVCIALLTDGMTSTYPPLSSRLQLDPKQQGISVTLPCVARKVSISEESQVLQQPSGECGTDIQARLGGLGGDRLLRAAVAGGKPW